MTETTKVGAGRIGHNGGPPLKITNQTIFRVVGPNRTFTMISNVLLGTSRSASNARGFW